MKISKLWSDNKLRAICYQIIALVGVLLAVYFFYFQLQSNLKGQNISSGFGFLGQEAGFEIAESLIEYWSDDSYLRALSVGLLNTIKVAIIGNIGAFILGLILALMRLGSNPLANLISFRIIHTIRNIPLLLQLFFWYGLFSEFLPGVKGAWSLFDRVKLCNRGLFLPWPEMSFWSWALVGISFIALVTIYLIPWKFWDERPKVKHSMGFLLLLLIIIPLSVVSWQIPKLAGFNFEGGLSFSPELAALLIGLITYTSAFMAEIIRAGINYVSRGQWEAGRALGLKEGQIVRFIILPQAFKIAFPPLTSQILNLTKNSSLAVAIAYPDFVAVTNTTLNQTGQAVECVSLIMAVYLFLSLTASAIMNWFNNRTKWGEAT